MISMGRSDLVRAKPIRVKKPKSAEKSLQELGCSDVLTDSIEPKDTVQSIVKNSSSPEKIKSQVETPQSPKTEELKENSIKSVEISNKQSVVSWSTGEKGLNEAAETSKPKQSKDLMSSIRSFFKRQLSIIHACINTFCHLFRCIFV